MKTCPQCGFNNMDTEARCLRCKTLLDQVNDPDPLTPVKRERVDFRPTRRRLPGSEWPGLVGAAILRKLYVILRRFPSELPEDVSFRNPWLSGALSLLPGLGQLYNHQPKKAAQLILVIAAAIAVAWKTIYLPESNFILLVLLLLWVYGCHDSFMTAKRINRDYCHWRTSGAFYLAWLMYVCMFCLLLQYVTSIFAVKYVHLSDDVMKPYLRQGERVLVNKLAYLIGRPKVGDVVLYDPPRIQTDIGRFIIVDRKNGFERVVAGPGQTYSRRGGVYYLDGQPAGPRGQPAMDDQIWWDFELTAPPDHYIVLFTYTGKSYDLVEGMVIAPDLDETIYRGWHEACIIPEDDIFGRAMFVYNPPWSRRILR